MQYAVYKAFMYIPICVILRYTSKGVQVKQYYSQNVFWLPKRLTKFTVNQQKVNWQYLEELEVHNLYIHYFHIRLPINMLNVLKKDLVVTEYSWDDMTKLYGIDNLITEHPVVKSDDYTILGVSEDDGIDKIQTVYRKLSLIYHPDTSTGNSEVFRQIDEAYKRIMEHKKNETT